MRKLAVWFALVSTLAATLLPPAVAEAQRRCSAGPCSGRPYGDYGPGHGRGRGWGRGWGRYGARSPVQTLEEARERLEAFYADQEVVVGRITERPLHFEAEIADRGGTVVDRVIIDKRSGRIRSIY